MAMSRHRSQAGFTIIELLIATAVFSTVLLICAFAIVHVGRMYFKGSLTSRTQDASRRIGEDVSQAIQFSAGGSAPRPGVSSTDPNLRAWCIGTIQYSYDVTRAMGTGGHALWKSRLPSIDSTCSPCDLTLATPCAGGEELLGDRMRIPQFNLTAASGGFRIDMIISYGEDASVFLEPFTVCQGVNASG